MNLGILGTGMIVQSTLPHWAEIGIPIGGILGTERSRERTQALAEQYRIPHCYYDYDALLGSDIDTVYIALPNSLHYAFARKALERGKHVIVEKPAAANLREWESLLRLAQERKLFLLEAMNIPYLPAFRALQKDLGSIGELRIVSLNYSQYSSRYDAFKAGTILPAFDCRKAGGALMDLNVYNVHAAAALFGKPKGVRYHANIRRGIDTSGILTLDYGDFQAVCIGAKDCAAPISCTFQGDGGTIQVTTPLSQMVRYRVKDQEKDFTDGLYRLTYEFREFDRIIREQDFETAARRNESSTVTAWILDTARKDAGIVFDND